MSRTGTVRSTGPGGVERMNAAQLLSHAGQRCPHRLGPGTCRPCLMEELQELLLEENPELSEADAHDLAW